jgi:hypothetical protein
VGDLIRFPIERRSGAKAPVLHAAHAQVSDAAFDRLATFGHMVAGGMELTWRSSFPMQPVIGTGFSNPDLFGTSTISKDENPI